MYLWCRICSKSVMASVFGGFGIPEGAMHVVGYRFGQAELMGVPVPAAELALAI